MTPEQIDEQLWKLAAQIVSPDRTQTLLRHDTPSRNWDRHTFQNDRENLRQLGVHVRRARTAEFDWTPDGFSMFGNDRAYPPFAKPRKGDLYFSIQKHIPPLFLMIHPQQSDVLVQGFWRGSARVETRLHNGEEIWLCKGESLREEARFCRRNHFFDMAQCDRFKSIVAGIAYSESFNTGKVQ